MFELNIRRSPVKRCCTSLKSNTHVEITGRDIHVIMSLINNYGVLMKTKCLIYMHSKLYTPILTPHCSIKQITICYFFLPITEGVYKMYLWHCMSLSYFGHTGEARNGKSLD